MFKGSFDDPFKFLCLYIIKQDLNVLRNILECFISLETKKFLLPNYSGILA